MLSIPQVPDRGSKRNNNKFATLRVYTPKSTTKWQILHFNCHMRTINIIFATQCCLLQLLALVIWLQPTECRDIDSLSHLLSKFLTECSQRPTYSCISIIVGLDAYLHIEIRWMSEATAPSATCLYTTGCSLCLLFDLRLTVWCCFSTCENLWDRLSFTRCLSYSWSLDIILRCCFRSICFVLIVLTSATPKKASPNGYSC